MTNYETLTRLESTGQLKQLIASGLMPVKVCSYLEIYRMIDMRVKTGAKKYHAVIEASESFKMCERTIFRVIRGMEK